MSVPALFKGRLSIPVIGSPMFIASTPELVIAQCKAGIVGSFPALNARPKEVLEDWLKRIAGELGEYAAKHPDKPVAPFAVNQIAHHSNDRLMHDVEICVKHKVPMFITSLKAPAEVVQAAHSYGGIVMHDVINVRHARKAIEAGVDGLILVCAGAGGHAGTHSPFALVSEVRRFFKGPIALSGAISNGAQVLAAQAMGADFAYIGTRFLATNEASVVPEYKQMLIDSAAADIVYTSLFSGVHANYLKKSVAASGMDPENLPEADKSKMNFGTEGSSHKKVWRDIWSAGQGTGTIDEVLPVADLVARMRREYDAARAALAAGVAADQAAE